MARKVIAARLALGDPRRYWMFGPLGLHHRSRGSHDRQVQQNRIFTDM